MNQLMEKCVDGGIFDIYYANRLHQQKIVETWDGGWGDGLVLYKDINMSMLAL